MPGSAHSGPIVPLCNCWDFLGLRNFLTCRLRKANCGYETHEPARRTQEKGITAAMDEFHKAHAKEHAAVQFKADPWAEVSDVLCNELFPEQKVRQGLRGSAA